MNVATFTRLNQPVKLVFAFAMLVFHQTLQENVVQVRESPILFFLEFFKNIFKNLDKFILYGEPCDVDAENEIYPTNAACIREEVRCKYGYRLSKDKLICQLDTFNYAGYGESCSSPYLNCHGNLECSMKKCNCPQIYERFDETNKQCVPRKIGDNCQLDSQCDRDAIEAYLPTSMECSLTNSTCQCLPWANCSETTTTTPIAKTYPGNSNPP